MVLAKLPAKESGKEISYQNDGGPEKDIKEHLIPEETFRKRDELPEGEEAEHPEDGGILHAGLPPIEKVDQESIEVRGEKTRGKYRGAGLS